MIATSVSVNVALGMFFLGLGVGLIVGMVIQWVFGGWEDYRRWEKHDSERKPW